MRNSSIQQTEKIKEIEYLRGFAILAVVAIHTSMNFTKITNVNLLLVLNVIVDVFSHFAVPLFIFISGFVLSLNYKGTFSQKKFLRKRVKSVIPSYIIFSTLYLLLNVILSAINGNLKIPSLMIIIFNFVTASSYYHLWYFALIIQFYIFYPSIIKTYDKYANNKIFYFIFLMLIIQELWLIIRDVIITYFDSSTHSYSIYFNAISSTILSRVFFSHIFYFTIGIYVCRNYQYTLDKLFKAKRWILPTIIVFTGIISSFWIDGIAKYGSYERIPQSYFIVPHLLASVYFPFVFSILFIISLNFSITKYKYSNYSKIILLLGRYSFGIYLIHALFITVIVTLVFPQFGVDVNCLIFYPTLFILSILLSCFSVYFISHLPYSEILIGIKNKK
jgi:peptidoglycan/LPS O-acetylase OafA/YrhL